MLCRRVIINYDKSIGPYNAFNILEHTIDGKDSPIHGVEMYLHNVNNSVVGAYVTDNVYEKIRTSKWATKMTDDSINGEIYYTRPDRTIKKRPIA